MSYDFSKLVVAVRKMNGDILDVGEASPNAVNSKSEPNQIMKRDVVPSFEYTDDCYYINKTSGGQRWKSACNKTRSSICKGKSEVG